MDNIELKRLRWIYSQAKRRCVSNLHPRYSDYGGRGIKFLFSSFEDFYSHLGPRPEGYELDRINNDGHYEPGNVRWCSFSVQQKNKRKYKNNTSGVKGVSYVSTLKKWIARCNEKDNGERRYLYVGKDFFEACCARKSWETNNCTI